MYAATLTYLLANNMRYITDAVIRLPWYLARSRERHHRRPHAGNVRY
jgi:hypothetical protein